jgi:hypothetical protein
LTLARVAMLAKPGESVNKPLGVRPITILSVLYRLERVSKSSSAVILGTVCTTADWRYCLQVEC